MFPRLYGKLVYYKFFQFFFWPSYFCFFVFTLFMIHISDEYILPKIAERNLRRFCNLRSTSSDLGLKLPLHKVLLFFSFFFFFFFYTNFLFINGLLKINYDDRILFGHSCPINLHSCTISTTLEDFKSSM